MLVEADESVEVADKPAAGTSYCSVFILELLVFSPPLLRPGNLRQVKISSTGLNNRIPPAANFPKTLEAQERHQWLELTLRPSLTTFICDLPLGLTLLLSLRGSYSWLVFMVPILAMQSVFSRSQYPQVLAWHLIKSVAHPGQAGGWRMLWEVQRSDGRWRR